MTWMLACVLLSIAQFLRELSSDPLTGSLRLLVGLAVLVGLSGVFAKAGKPRWAVLVPFKSDLTLLEIVDKPRWWILPMLLPLAAGLLLAPDDQAFGPESTLFLALVIVITGCIFAVALSSALARCFGKSTTYSLGLILAPFVFLPMLGFGPLIYRRPCVSIRPRRLRAIF